MNMQHSHTTDGAGLMASFGPEGTERDQMEWNEEGPDGTERDQMERRGTRRNGTKRDQKERRGTRWNGEGPEGTKRDQMERRGTRRNEEGPDGMERIGARWNGTERDQMERRGTRRNEEGPEETEKDLRERRREKNQMEGFKGEVRAQRYQMERIGDRWNGGKRGGPVPPSPSLPARPVPSDTYLRERRQFPIQVLSSLNSTAAHPTQPFILLAFKIR